MRHENSAAGRQLSILIDELDLPTDEAERDGYPRFFEESMEKIAERLRRVRVSVIRQPDGFRFIVSLS